MTNFVDKALNNYLPRILDEVPVPDDDEEMNWRLFFAHSQDMQGFRADIFTGGPNEAHRPGFRGLRDRWQGNSRELVKGLADAWKDASLHQVLSTSKSVDPSIWALQNSPYAGAQVFGQALADLKGAKIARKTNKMIRAYLANSHMLAQCFHASFRRYLASIHPLDDVTNLTPAVEEKWVNRIWRDFNNVGRTMAGYMICDWLLWLWKEGRIGWFVTHKEDTVFKSAVDRGLVPTGMSFIQLCQSTPIPPGFGALSGNPCPPRVLNECIWFEFNGSGS